MRLRILALGLCLVTVASTAVAGAQTVTPEGSSHHVATEAAYRAALAALASEVIPGTITLEGDIVLDDGTDPTYAGTQPLTIDGQGFTLSGNEQSRVLAATGGSKPLLTLRDITVSDGASNGSGGAVSWPGPVTVLDSTFEGNAVSGPAGTSGGAISANTSVTVDNSTFRGNTVVATTGSALGGAIVVSEAGASATVTSSVFSENTATADAGAAGGGAIRVIAEIDVADSVFLRNEVTGTADATGGALSGDTVIVDQAAMTANTALGGNALVLGGAVFAQTLATIVDSTLRDNEVDSTVVDGFGGSAVGSFLDVELRDSTVVDNVADGAAVDATDVTATNVTLAGNTGSPANLRTFGQTMLRGTVIGDPTGGANCSVGTVVSSFRNVVSDGTCELGGPSNLVDVGDLLLGPTRDNGGTVFGPVDNQFQALTRFPLAGSPVLDRIPTAACTDMVDQRGVSRPFGSGCDAGAIEAVFEPHPFTDVDAWVEDAVRWLASDANRPPLMVGLSPTEFGHELPILRSQVVRLLHRLMGEPDPLAYPPHPFTDVPPWVEGAVRWAYGEGIVTGETPTLFKPNDPITRGQVVRMVYRVAGSPDVSGIDPPPFDDVPGWVADAIRWAADPDNPLPLMTGETPTQFNAEEDITRGQVARLVWRLALTPRAWADPDAAPTTVLFRAGIQP